MPDTHPKDLKVVLGVPGVNSTDCVSGFDWTGMQIAHRDNVSIYGPGPAHTHESWSGNNCDDPDSDGYFTVPSDPDGTPALTLDIASNYDGILDEVPQQDLPEGMPGCPAIYWYMKADVWRSYHGATRPGGGTFYSPYEGVYCWKGWAWLKLNLVAPSAATLRLTLTNRTYTYSDNHVGSSVRQTGDEVYGFAPFSYTKTDTVYTWDFSVTAGANTVYLCLMKPRETAHPKLERAVSIEISRFTEGEWQLSDAPRLVRDPLLTAPDAASTVKSFEGYEYHQGGFSAQVDCNHEGMYCGDDNGGHKNVAEATIPMWDYVETYEYALDITTAMTISSMADVITKHSDAYTAALDETGADWALEDDEDPPNRLGDWAFYIREPLTQAGSPLRQEVGEELNARIQVGTWSIAPGVRCAVKVRHVVHGQFEGFAYGSDSLPARSQQDVLQVWRREPGGEWAKHGSPIDTNEAGYYQSGTLEEVCAYTLNMHGEYDPSFWEYTVTLATAESPDVDDAWEPIGDYEVGALTVYEGVQCYGECDEFCQRFWEAKFAAEFPELWWNASSLEAMIAGMPTGATWTDYNGSNQAAPGDIVIIYTPSGEYLHAVILHGYEESTWYFANSNRDGDWLGYFDTSASFEGFQVLGWFHYEGSEVVGQRAPTREMISLEMAIIALVPVHLHAAWHPVPQMTVVVQVPQEDAGPAGMRLLKRDGWTDKAEIPDTSTTQWAMTAIGIGDMLLIEGVTRDETGNGVYSRKVLSLAGEFGDKVSVTGDDRAPTAILDGNKLRIVRYDPTDGNQWFETRDLSAPETMLDLPKLVGPSADMPASLIMLPKYWRLLCAVQAEDEQTVVVYQSVDGGLTWDSILTTTGKYPVLCAGENWWWMLVYEEESADGAAGRLVCRRYDASEETAVISGYEGIVGGSDDGRPGFTQDPVTWELIALACKADDWMTDGATPGIAEYRANDLGENWRLVQIVEV